MVKIRSFIDEILFCFVLVVGVHAVVDPRNLHWCLGQNWISNRWNFVVVVVVIDVGVVIVVVVYIIYVVVVDPRNQCLKLCQNKFSNSWEIFDIDFLWWVGCGVQSRFHCGFGFAGNGEALS